MTPLPSAKALDNYFLEARSKLLDLAAILDRISRGRDAASTDAPAGMAGPPRHHGGRRTHCAS